LDDVNIDNFRIGNEEEFSTLFRKYYEQLYMFAGHFVKDPQSAENIVQDVFVKLWIDRKKIIIRSNVKSYLYTSVKNLSLNFIKREGRLLSINEQLETIGENSSNPEAEYIKNESYISINKAIEELPEKCRRIYKMKRYDDLSYAEIAEILGISINTIKTQMKRAIKSLNKKLIHLKTIIIIFFIGKM